MTSRMGALDFPEALSLDKRSLDRAGLEGASLKRTVLNRRSLDGASLNRRSLDRMREGLSQMATSSLHHPDPQIHHHLPAAATPAATCIQLRSTGLCGSTAFTS